MNFIREFVEIPFGSLWGFYSGVCGDFIREFVENQTCLLLIFNAISK